MIGMGLVTGVFALALVILLGLLNPEFMNLLGTESDPESILERYSLWYFILMAGCVFGAVLIVVVDVIVFRYLLRMFLHKTSEKEIRQYFQNFLSFGVLMVLFFAFYAIVAGGMLLKEEIPQNWQRARQDLAQIESGDLEQVTVWLSPKIQAVPFPEYYSAGQPKLLTRYGGISSETGGEWVRFYVPDSLDFSLDPDALYDENKSIEWNTDNAQQYQITYTVNLHMVLSAVPV